MQSTDSTRTSSRCSIKSLGVKRNFGLVVVGEVVDTIAILYRDEDVEMYKEGDFKIKAYRVGDPLAALENISGDRHPEVFTAKSGKLLNYSINGTKGTCSNVRAVPQSLMYDKRLLVTRVW